MKPIDRAVDDLILHLYRGSTEVGFDRFQDWALARIAEVVRFDAAWWGKANATPNRILSVHLLNADPSILEDYQRIDAVDVFRDTMLGRPGITVNLSDLMSRREFERSPIYLRYGRKHRVEAAVGTVLHEPVSSMLDFLTLWRFDPRWPFSETDRQVVERVMPHLVEANRICRLLSLQGEHLALGPGDPVRPWALASTDDGCLLEVNASFVALARREWPQWQTAELPAALRRLLRRCETYMGAAIVITIRDVDGYRLLVARPRRPAEKLGPRESEVLQRYAGGQSYREISAALGTSPATVRNQLARIYRKLGVHNKAELIHAIQDGETPTASGTDPTQRSVVFATQPPLPLAELVKPAATPEPKNPAPAGDLPD